MSDPRLARPLWRGRTNVDALTIAALEHAEQLGGHPFRITQGSYQNGAGDTNSAGTHDAGGVVDAGWCGHPRCVLALRRAGFAAWHRTPEQGPWPDHIHAVLVDHPLLAAGAAAQVREYRAGGDGLKGDRPDDGPRLDPIPVYEWKETPDMNEQQEDRILAGFDALDARVQRNTLVLANLIRQVIAGDAAAANRIVDAIEAGDDAILDALIAEVPTP